MNREIIFRGKNFYNDEWVYGSLVKAYDMGDVCYYIIPHKAEHLDGAEFDECYRVVYATVGQFTGLVDKNGAKIFEGDIVSSEGGKSADVEWFRGRYLPFNAYPEYRCWNEDDVEVIGNTHDNPDLLEG